MSLVFAVPFSLGARWAAESRDDSTLAVTTSVGVAVYPEDAEDARSLLRNADRAMYAAKRAGRSTYRRYAEAPQDPA